MQEYVLKYVVPSFGVLTALCIFLSPLRGVLEARRSGNLGAQNPFVFACMLNNCLVSILYSFILKDAFIFWANVPGWLLSGYYVLMAVSLLRPDMPVFGTTLLTLGFGQFTILLCGFVGLFIASTGTGTFVLGIATITSLCIFYTSPLSVLYQVIKTRDARGFPWPLLLTCLVNSFLWSIYGIAINDYMVVAGPNIFGFVVTLVQLGCKLLFRSGSIILETSGDEEQTILPAANSA